jgi:hypothetical protein
MKAWAGIHSNTCKYVLVFASEARQSRPCKAAEFKQYESDEIWIFGLTNSAALLVARLPRFARKDEHALMGNNMVHLRPRYYLA